MLIVHSLLFLVLGSNVTPQPVLLYNWIQSPPAPAPALLYHPQYWIRPSPPLIQMPYFHTPAHPLEQDPEMVVVLEPESESCSESVSSYPDPLYCDKYHICSGSVVDGWKVIIIVYYLINDFVLSRLKKEHVLLASFITQGLRSVMVGRGDLGWS